MLKFTFHSLRRVKERGLSLNAIADRVMRSCIAGNKKTRLPAGDMTVVAKREGRELVVITAWKNRERKIK